MRLLHLSDTHVSASGPDEDGVDAVGALEGLLHDVRHVADLDLVVVSGDVADDGSTQGAATVRELVGAFARDRGVPHVYCPGNHDRRPGFRAALGSGHLAAGGADVGTPIVDGGSLAAVSAVSGRAGSTRVVTLDSLVVGETWGRVGDLQLEALRRLLADPAPGGTVLVLHHPPIAVPGVPFTADVVLRDPAALGEVIRGSDVRVVLAGHLHLQLNGSLAGVPVWATPGVVTRIDLTAPPGETGGVLGASATVVDLAADGSVTTVLLHARDPRAGEPVYCYDPVTGVDLADTD